jgi:dienelactone hydrolase
MSLRDLGRWLLPASLVSLLVAAPAFGAGPEPGSPEFIQRDNQNMRDAYGRQIGPGGQLENTAFTQALFAEHTENGIRQLAEQAAQPNRPALTPGNVFPGWNGGNPLRRGWDGTRGQIKRVAWTNRYGALIRGDVFAPLPGARDPYTGKRLKPPYPGVVITTGSIQGSERMYWWLAQDLAERGYVVLTYDVQGQGTSETFPHENDQVNALPFCNPFAEPQNLEQYGCPGVPAQQASNFVYGTQDALSFFLSTPGKPYKNRNASDAHVNDFNPYWKLFDRRRDRRTVTRGRTTKVGIIGHSLGAFAVSYVQGIDSRVQTAVALDKLSAGSDRAGSTSVPPVKPVVPALGIQSEYGFTVNPYFMNNGSSLTPQPAPPNQGPDPKRELATGFAKWKEAGVDSMMIVPRASTHLEYTDIAYVMPASRYGQALSSVYTQAWLDRYLKHKGESRRSVRKRVPDPLQATSFDYLEPTDVGKWDKIKLDRASLLSFYYCSGFDYRKPGAKKARIASNDMAGVGGC